MYLLTEQIVEIKEYKKALKEYSDDFNCGIDMLTPRKYLRKTSSNSFRRFRLIGISVPFCMVTTLVVAD